MRFLLPIIFVISTAGAAPCDPLDGVFVNDSGPPNLAGHFNFTRFAFDMSLTYNGTSYRVGSIPYDMKDQHTTELGCWVYIALDVLVRLPKPVKEYVGLSLLYFNKGSLTLPVKFKGQATQTIAAFKKQ
ncbi:hypothetical protein FOZ63_008588 [Perkinsus olseni]|uniref:Uncharacterized protein n=1 Tax=Perkinsus olseni TaxID=32597 RepID=A0A7J6SFF4_PEROL|nr:hypothetical protein FOZ62_003427 [Perkinsus olseni]KAF4731365.1 hypothetical protein FOZ63_008588 [Perkinsus olseni]